ncbi:MAG: hypothetical protein KME58_12495, partial [Candidatus Thiodiazotropha sp. (ex Lucina pensylvanica)]|nr:hypothetical protein [Candidatus Thiodiazotropha sp. (ex Lucina pensylvanica)]
PRHVVNITQTRRFKLAHNHRIRLRVGRVRQDDYFLVDKRMWHWHLLVFINLYKGARPAMAGLFVDKSGVF